MSRTFTDYKDRQPEDVDLDKVGYRLKKSISCCGVCAHNRYDATDEIYCYELMQVVSANGICKRFEKGYRNE